jgi:hypothetical protein
MCKKYNIPNVRLFLHDARTFRVLSPEILSELEAGKLCEEAKVESADGNGIQIEDALFYDGESRPEESENFAMEEENNDRHNNYESEKFVIEEKLNADVLRTTNQQQKLVRNTEVSLSKEEMEKQARKRKHEQAVRKKQKRHAKKKKCQQDQPNLFFCSNWRFRSASNALYDKV